ncbi:MAG: UDP-N-acetylglucosamine 2-epimerase (non-hydrolyzing) [Polyangiales bacterium]
MTQQRVVFVAGARPNFMKVAPMLRAMAAPGSRFESALVHTGQHYDAAMSDVFFEELGIPSPDVHLNVGSGAHGAQTAKVLAAFEEWLMAQPALPRGVVVVGDVNSTMACTLAAVKLGVAVAHVEAGLRSYDRTMPEEINRLVTDSVADLLLTSEPSGDANLAKEGVDPKRVHFVGNLMIDSVAYELPRAKALNVPARFGHAAKGYALVTLHRPSNVDTAERLGALVEFLEQTAKRVPVVFPTHPRTRERLTRFGLIDRVVKNTAVKITDPLGYRDNLGLMADARYVLTDSGGIQEETSYLGVPCLTLRHNTERPVTVTQGTNTIVGDDLAKAFSLVNDIVEGRYKTGGPIAGWDGRAAERVARVLEESWA